MVWRGDDWVPVEPEPVEQATEPTEVRAYSRAAQWAEHLSLMLMLGFLIGLATVGLLWWYLG
jgi:hypothetical protein